MAKILFKGIQQVTMNTFNNVEDKKGYLWFVREPMDANGEEGGDGDLGNDRYHIYFGTRCYGSFWDGQMEAMATALSALKTALGLDDNFAFNFEGAENVTAALVSLQSQLTTLSGVVDTKASKTEVAQSIEDALADFLVKDIDANDKVLSVADGILSAQVGLSYTDGRIVLTGKNGEIAGFDASDFVKDSFLDDVKVDTKEDGEKYIIFTWNTVDGETKTDEIKVSDFAKLYNAGTALELAEDGVTFNVKVAEANNFLSVNSNNELIVDDMTVDKTVLKEAITIEGGPLADIAKQAYTGGTVPVGTSIQEFLKNLLCVEIYPKPTANTSKIAYSVSITAPTISASVTKNTLVEVGQTITFSAVTANAVSVTKTAPKVETFEHGYSDTIDGEINTGKTISGVWTINPMDGQVYQLSASASKFSGTIPTTVTASTAASCSLAACTLTAVLGTNTYSVTEDAPKYEGTYTGVESKYVVSNLGGRSEDEKSPAIAAKTTAIEKDPDNQTASFSVTGVYPVFNNMVSTGASNTVAVTKKMTLSSGNTFEISYGPETDAFHAFAYPATHSLSSVEIYNSMSKEYEVYSGGSSTEDATYEIQGVNTDYKVWKRAGNAYSDPTKFKFTLNKNLNTK